MKKLMMIGYALLWVGLVVLNCESFIHYQSPTQLQGALSIFFIIYWVAYAYISRDDENLITFSYFGGLYSFLASLCFFFTTLLGGSYGGILGYMYICLIGPLYGLLAFIPSKMAFAIFVLIFTFVMGVSGKILSVRANYIPDVIEAAKKKKELEKNNK